MGIGRIIKERIENNTIRTIVKKTGNKTLQRLNRLRERRNRANRLKRRMNWAIEKMKPKEQEQTKFENQVKEANKFRSHFRGISEKIKKGAGTKEVVKEELAKTTEEAGKKLKINPRLAHDFVQKAKQRLNEIAFKIENAPLKEKQKQKELWTLDFTASSILEKMMPLEEYVRELDVMGYSKQDIDRWARRFLEIVK